MTTFNKTDLLDQKKAGKHYYFFVIENHPAIIVLENFDYEFLTMVNIRNLQEVAQIEIEEVTV